MNLRLGRVEIVSGGKLELRAVFPLYIVFSSTGIERERNESSLFCQTVDPPVTVRTKTCPVYRLGSRSPCRSLMIRAALQPLLSSGGGKQ